MNIAAILLATSIVINGGFEDGVTEWNVPRECWRVVDGAGRDGSKALVWENDDVNKYVYPGQSVKFEPFVRYRFTGWVKVEREDAGKIKPAIGIECVAADGKWLFGDYALPVVNNDPNTQGWTRYEGMTRPLPINVARVKLLAYVHKGGAGKVKFDEITLEALPERPIVNLQCSAYRDSFCEADGDIRLATMLQVNTFRMSLDKCSCEVEFINAKGAKEQRAMKIMGADFAEGFIKAGDFAMGKQTIIARLSHKGEKVGEVTLPIERTATKVSRKIEIDSTGRVVKEGKRIFPLGLYTSWPTEAMIAHWKGSPFDFVVQYGGAKKEHLDLWESVGVSACIDVRGLIFGYNYSRLTSKYNTLEESKAAFEKSYAWCVDHPAFFGWYLVDEAPVYMIPNVTTINRFLREFDPDHPTYMVTDKPQDIREYMPTFDAIGVDAYPIGNTGGTYDKCSGWARTCIEQVYGMRPLWFVPQMFNWGWYRKDDIGKADVRMPTREEMANMTWQGIAAGANGICGYSFANLYKDLEGEEFERVWEEVCSIGREIRAVEHILLAKDIDHGVKSIPDSLVIRGYQYGGKDVLLVVNRRRESVKATLELKRRYTAAKVGLGGGVTLKGENQLEVDFPACGYAMIALEAIR